MTNPSLSPGRGPTPTDAEIGKRIRVRRLLIGMKQKALAEALGVCTQQVRKYEYGINRVGSSRLTRVADVLGVPISYFFDDAGAPTASPHMPTDLMERAETWRLMRLYYAIRSETVRLKVLAILEAVAEASETRAEALAPPFPAEKCQPPGGQASSIRLKSLPLKGNNCPRHQEPRGSENKTPRLEAGAS